MKTFNKYQYDGDHQDGQGAGESESAPNPAAVRKRAFRSIAQKINVITTLALKIGRMNGFDDLFRIRNQDGEFIENSNIITWLNHATSPGKVLVGEAEFVDLLYEAKVDPNILVNEGLRFKLNNKYSKKIAPVSPDPPISTPVSLGSYWGPAEAARRLGQTPRVRSNIADETKTSEEGVKDEKSSESSTSSMDLSRPSNKRRRDSTLDEADENETQPKRKDDWRWTELPPDNGDWA